MSPMKSCCSDIILAAYLDGTLTEIEKTEVEQHLREHKECREAVAAMRNALAAQEAIGASPAPESVVERAIRLYPGRRHPLDLVLSLVRDGLHIVSAAFDVSIRGSLPAPALRTTKHEGPALVIMTKTVEAMTAEVALEKLSSGRCTITVKVSDGVSREPVEDLRVELVSGGRVLDSSVAQSGMTVFEEIGPGKYDIVIRKIKGSVSGTLALEIRNDMTADK